MKVKTLSEILEGMPYGAEVKVLGLNQMQRHTVDRIEVRETTTGIEVLIVTLGTPR